MSKITPSAITDILGGSQTDRKLRAYAYLQASFAAKSGVGHDVSDIVDCIMPFLVEGIANQAGNQLDIAALQAFLEHHYDFQIPIFAIEQLVSRAQNLGALEWNTVAKFHVCVDIRDDLGELEVGRNLLDDDYEVIEVALSKFATGLGHSEPFSSENWTDALIAFLRSGWGDEAPKTAVIEGAIVTDSGKLDHYLAARFIQYAYEEDRPIFDSIINIFTGVLVEEFIGSIQVISLPDDYETLTIYYDTSVLLRLLGSSGPILGDATLELHSSLQSLGCKTAYFEHTENEVVNILGAILANYDSGRELHGETAEALLNAEIEIPFIRDLEATFLARLAKHNILKSKFAYENTKTANYYQIDEHSFDGFLQGQAELRRVRYSRHNRINDSKTLAVIMRLRHGAREIDVAKSKHLFVTANKLLSRSARSYIADQEEFGWRNAPPMLTVGQISTLSWLAGSRELEYGRVSKQLLANCYSAVQPDPEWTPEFLSALQKYREENADSDIAESAVFLQAARRIAQNQSLSNTAVFRQLSTVEIFARAALEAEAQKEDLLSGAEIREAEAHQRGYETGRTQVGIERQEVIRNRAEQWADAIMVTMKVVAILICIGSFLLSEAIFGLGLPGLTMAAKIVSGVVAILFILTLFQVQYVSYPFALMRAAILKKLEAFFTID